MSQHNPFARPATAADLRMTAEMLRVLRGDLAERLDALAVVVDELMSLYDNVRDAESELWAARLRLLDTANRITDDHQAIVAIRLAKEYREGNANTGGLVVPHSVR